ncbi:hypothetical protein ABWH91_00570 [Phycisphaerales bacterium ac7]
MRSSRSIIAPHPSAAPDRPRDPLGTFDQFDGAVALERLPREPGRLAALDQRAQVLVAINRQH